MISELRDRTLLSRRSKALSMLLLVYILNFVDRQIIAILAVPIKADLHLSDTEMGLLGGLAFALFYTGFGIPVAMLADRRDRSKIIAISLFIWSLMTMLCGFTQSFWQLFMARLGVGIGEAGGVAPAYSLISDLFPPEKRARALAIYSFGIPIGGACGIIFGGLIATMISWREAFVIVGILGIIITPVFRSVVRDPRINRGVKDYDAANFTVVLKTLCRKPSFWFLSFGASSSAMIGYGLMFWLPSFFVRTFDISLLDASLIYGGALFIGGTAGIWIGGVLSDRFGAKSKAAFALVPAIAFTATAPLYVLAISSNTLWLTFLAMLAPMALGVVWLGPVITAIQGIVPSSMRSTASAVFLFINNLIGIGVGTPAIGWLSDTLQMGHGKEALRYAILTGTGFYVVAALLLFIAAKYLNRDWCNKM